MKHRLPLVALFVFALCLAAPLASAQSDTDLIPRSVLFGNPEKGSARISPDGTRISYLAPVDGVMNVWVGPIGSPNLAKPVTNDTFRGIRSYFWAYDDSHILYTQDSGGDENWHVYKVNVATGQTSDLTPGDGIQAQVLGVSHNFPTTILIGLNDRNPQLHDVWKFDLETNQRELLLENPGYAGFVIDEEYKVRIGSKFEPNGSVIMDRYQNGEWTHFETVPHEDNLTTNAMGFDKSGNILYMLDSRGRNTAALYALNLSTFDKRLVAQHKKVDIGGVMIHPTEGRVQAVSFDFTRPEWKVLDRSVRDDFRALERVAKGDMKVSSRTLDDRTWIVSSSQDDGPPEYYLWNRDKQKAKFLFTTQPALEDQPLVEMQPKVVTSRDGYDLVCYLSMPEEQDEDTGRRYSVKSASAKKKGPSAPPMVLLVHGGPWGRDHWGFNPLHQLLANRGYAVLSVNFRGSTGFGKEFVNAGDLQWGRKMHDDLIDACNWAVERGYADPDKIAIMGGSYGGYATLAGVTMTPDYFACGVDIVGPSNLITLLESIPPYWAPIVAVFKLRMGNPDTEEGRALLIDRSPLTHVDKIKKPLLIGQGAHDPRVKQAESDQIVSAMQAKNIPVTYVLFPDEGHGFRRPQNSMAFWAVTEAFLAEHLGGRFEPVRDGEFEGTSITIPAGRELIGGLPANLGN